MKKQNLLSKAELRKVLGGAMAKDLCSTSSCYFEYLSVGYYGECGSSISDDGPLACTCSALGPFGEVIQSDPMPVCYVA